MKEITKYPSSLSGANHRIFLNLASDKVIIFFAAKNMKDSQYNFWQLGREIDANVIFLNDTDNQWYLSGINSLGDSYQDILEILQRWVDHMKCSQVYTVGTSMGGYGALKYGMDLRAKILAFSIKYTSFNTFVTGKNLRNFKEQISNYKKSISLIVGEASPEDLIFAGLLKEYAKIDLISLIGVDHYVPSFISRDSKMYRLINKFLNNDVISKDYFSNGGDFSGFDKELNNFFLLSYTSFINRDYDEAIKFSKQILNDFPLFGGALTIVGRSYFKKQKYDLCLEYLAKAILVAPNEKELHYIYACAANELGCGQSGFYLFKKIIEKFPNYAGPYYSLGILLEKQGLNKEALELYERTCLLNPKHEKAKIRYLKLEKVFNNI